MDHTGCHRLHRVLTHNNAVSDECEPWLRETPDSPEVGLCRLNSFDP
jgi:hypothetical protein